MKWYRINNMWGKVVGSGVNYYKRVDEGYVYWRISTYS